MRCLAILLVLLLALLMSVTAYAQTKFPVVVDTDNERLTYCYMAQEKLRLEHNVKGAEYKDDKISKSQWEAYLADEFDPLQEKIIIELQKQKANAKASKTWEVKLEDF